MYYGQVLHSVASGSCGPQLIGVLNASDLHLCTQLTISPRPTSEHNSAGLLPSPFSLSAPELVTCSVLPQSLPLPDWLISRNRVAPRSLFTSRVLRKSSQLVQTATSAPAAPGHQRGQEPVTNSGSGGDRPQNEEAGSSRSGANSCRNAHRALRRQCGHDFFQRNADTDTRGGTEADPDSPRECREMAQSSSPSVTEDMSLSGKECGGSAVWTGFQQVKKRSTDAAEVQHKTGRGDTGKECQGIRKPYVYAELTAVQANRGVSHIAGARGQMLHPSRSGELHRGQVPLGCLRCHRGRQQSGNPPFIR